MGWSCDEGGARVCLRCITRPSAVRVRYTRKHSALNHTNLVHRFSHRYSHRYIYTEFNTQTYHRSSYHTNLTQIFVHKPSWVQLLVSDLTVKDEMLSVAGELPAMRTSQAENISYMSLHMLWEVSDHDTVNLVLSLQLLFRVGLLASFIQGEGDVFSDIILHTRHTHSPSHIVVHSFLVYNNPCFTIHI